MLEPGKEEIFTTFVEDFDGADISLLCLCGELDASSVSGFLWELQRVVERKKDLVMDVHLLEYVDSAGIAAMLSAQNALADLGKRIYLVGCHGILSKIIHITQTEDELLCFEDLESVIDLLKSQKT
jgi:anti-anti-sigma factor